MKNTANKFTQFKKNFLVLLIVSLASCARKVNFQTSSVVPAARGYVQIKKDNNNNNLIDVNLSGLAEVERLQPSKKTYVVWMLTDQDITKNIGQINSSTGIFSKQLKASFKTVSTFIPIKIFITAEDDANIQYPGNQIILSTDRFYQ